MIDARAHGHSPLGIAVQEGSEEIHDTAAS